MIAEDSVVAHGSSTKKAKSSKLRRTRGKCGEVRGSIERVGMQRFLEVERKGVEKLWNEIQTPKGHFGR